MQPHASEMLYLSFGWHLELTKFGKPTCVEVVFCYQLFLRLFFFKKKINHFSCVYKIKLDIIKKNLIQAVSNQDGKYWVPHSHVHIRTHSLLQTEYPLFKVPETQVFQILNWDYLATHRELTR